MPGILNKVKLEANQLLKPGSYKIGPVHIIYITVAFLAIFFLALDQTANQVILLTYLIMLVGSMVLVAFLHFTGYITVEVKLREIGQAEIIAGLAGFVGLIIVQMLFGSAIVAGSLWTRNIMAYVAPPAEEMLFRVAILGLFIAQGTIFYLILGTALSSLLFAGFHYAVYAVSNPLIFGMLFMSGLVLSLTFLNSMNSDSDTISHGLNNFFASLHS